MPIKMMSQATVSRTSGKGLYSGIANLLRQQVDRVRRVGTAPGGFTLDEGVVQAMLDAAVSPHAVGQADRLAGGRRSYLGAVRHDLRKAARGQSALDEVFHSRGHGTGLDL